MDKIEPKFHVGDVVTNISGLYPNVTPTINEVDIINQCYRYKEIGGITWFKEQDKFKLVDTKPIFKIGDKVKGMFNNPNRVCVINYINNKFKCYHFFNNSITIDFKDQYKLTLVETDNCRHPVKDNTDAAIIGNNIVKDVNLYLKVEEVKTIQAKAVGTKIGSSIIETIMKDIKKAAAEGKSEIKIKYKDYNISNNNIPYVCYWGRICGFVVTAYDELAYIKW